MSKKKKTRKQKEKAWERTAKQFKQASLKLSQAEDGESSRIIDNKHEKNKSMQYSPVQKEDYSPKNENESGYHSRDLRNSLLLLAIFIFIIVLLAISESKYHYLTLLTNKLMDVLIK